MAHTARGKMSSNRYPSGIPSKTHTINRAAVMHKAWKPKKK